MFPDIFLGLACVDFFASGLRIQQWQTPEDKIQKYINSSFKGEEKNKTKKCNKMFSMDLIYEDPTCSLTRQNRINQLDKWRSLAGPFRPGPDRLH